MCFWKELELYEGRRVQKREETCKKDWQLEGTAVIQRLLIQNVKFWRLWKSHWLKKYKITYVLMLKLFLWLRYFGNSDRLKTFFLNNLSVFFHSASWSLHSTHEHSVSLECIVNSEIIKDFTKFLNCDSSKLAEYFKRLHHSVIVA